jgi:putative ABC transport system permease protein
MIGLGLVVFALIFGASLRESTTAAIDEQFASDFQVRSQNFQSFPSEVEDEVAALPEIDTTAELRVGQVGIDGRVGTVAAIEADELDAAFSLETTDGSLDAFSQGGLLITDDAAGRLDIAAGDALAVTFPQTGEQQVPVRAVIDGSGLDVDYLLTEQLFLDNVNDDGIQTLFTTVTEGTSLSAARTAIENATEPYPALNVQDSEDVKEEIAGQVNQILGLMSALLGLSILIALFGIANTLSLSVFERIRELGLLRAVGATRSQVRSIVRWESVLIAVLGALFGIVVGAVFGWMTVRALADTGVSVFAFPTGQVVVAVVVAALAGMLAAILPARRAARVDVLRALAAD